MAFRQAGVGHGEQAVPGTRMSMFGVVVQTTGFDGSQFAPTVRNSHEKSLRLCTTCGVRFVCEKLAFHGALTPRTAVGPSAALTVPDSSRSSKTGVPAERTSKAQP